MKITTEIITDWFKNFNIIYFENKLPMPEFEVSKKSYVKLGLCHHEQNPLYFGDMSRPRSMWYNFKITIYDYYDRLEFYFKNTLLHEMIHEWQMVTYGKAGHRATFQRKAAEINRKGGWKISTYANLREEGFQKPERKMNVTPEVKKNEYIVILENSPRTRFVARLAGQSCLKAISNNYRSQRPKFYQIVKTSTFANYKTTGRGYRRIYGKEFRADSPNLQEVYNSVKPLA